MITKQLVTERLAALELQRDNTKATLHAVDGAIQDCKYWLDLLNQDEGASAPSPDVEKD